MIVENMTLSLIGQLDSISPFVGDNPHECDSITSYSLIPQTAASASVKFALKQRGEIQDFYQPQMTQKLY